MKIIALALAASAAASGVRFPEMSYDAGWSRSSAPLDKPVSFAFHVRQQNLPRLMQIALDVSTPSHPSMATS